MLIPNLSFQVSWFGIEKFSSLTEDGLFISREMKFTITVASRYTTKQTCKAPQRICFWSSSVRLSRTLLQHPAHQGAVGLYRLQWATSSQWHTGPAIHHPVRKATSLPRKQSGSFLNYHGKVHRGHDRRGLPKTHSSISNSSTRQTKEAICRVC